jgi:site-specific recombinase XerD
MMRSRIDDFDFETKTVLVREKKRSRTRATTYRRVDLADSLIDVLTAWFEVHPGGQFSFCMPPLNGGIPSELTRDQARVQFNRTVRKSKWENVRGYHVLRHSFASNLASKGADQRIIDEFRPKQCDFGIAIFCHRSSETLSSCLNRSHSKQTLNFVGITSLRTLPTDNGDHNERGNRLRRSIGCLSPIHR